MKTRILAATAAIALMTAPMALADGHTQLVEQVTNQMLELDVQPAGFEYLTVDDLAQIKEIVESGDENSAKVERIEEVIATKAEASGEDTEAPAIFLITSDLRDAIEAKLDEMGYDVEGDTLNVEQIAEIKAVMESEDLSDAEAKARVDAALAM